MEKKYLAVNAGSASKKYALFEGDREIWRAHFEKEGNGFVVAFRSDDHTEKLSVKEEEFASSIVFLRDRIGKLNVTAVRVVAPGEYFLQNRKIDSRFLKKLETASEQAPLHIAPALTEIKQLQELFPNAMLIGVSDSVFFADMPQHSRLYSLPDSTVKKFGIYRYGYHGISVRSVIGKLEKTMNPIPSRIVICHLGGGSTVAAVKEGKPFDTSMGFTPLEGLPMATRIGNIDAGAVIFLAKKSGMDLEELESFLNKKCGLLGLSSKTSDVRELIELEENGDVKAARALESFVYHIKKYIGAYSAAMGGLDLLVFTATIGERSFIMRHRVCSDLEYLGVSINETKNNNTVEHDGIISNDQSTTTVAVITTDELAEIHRQATLLT